MKRAQICPVAHAQRANFIRDLGKSVPSLAAGVDDVVIIVVAAIGQTSFYLTAECRYQIITIALWVGVW